MAFLNLVFLLVVGFVPLSILTGIFFLVWRLLLRKTKQPNQAAVLASLGSTAAFAVGTFLWLFRPAARFENAFGFPPPDDVRGLTASGFILGDHGERTIHFRASEATARRVIEACFGDGRPFRDTETGRSSEQVGRTTVHERMYESEAFAAEWQELHWGPVETAVRYEWEGFD